MSTLLHLDSSPLGEASISRHLSNEFVQNWKKANPTEKSFAAIPLPQPFLPSQQPMLQPYTRQPTPLHQSRNSSSPFRTP